MSVIEEWRLLDLENQDVVRVYVNSGEADDADDHGNRARGVPPGLPRVTRTPH
jgi:hypothetical protein